MSPSWIRRRQLAQRRSYQVLYRRGGRGYKIETAGSFKTEREAKLRRDLVAGWLATGLNPKLELAKLNAPTVKARTLTEWDVSFLASRVDLAPATAEKTKYMTKALTDQLGSRDPVSLTVADIQDVVASLTELAPSTVKTYVEKWRLLLDYAGCDPNPARSPQLRLPRVVREQLAPPTADAFIAAVTLLPKHYHLPMVVLEQTGMRVGEAETLTWGDVDETTGRFRLRATSTKTRRARWVQLPEWLMTIVSATVAPEDRTAGRRVFPRFNQDSARQALAHACPKAGVPYFTPHDLRHRRATLWHHAGVPTRVMMELGGWASAELPVETYSHVLPLDEAPVARLEALLVRAR